MEAIRPAEWRLYRCGRHHLCRQFRIQHDAESGLQARSADRQCKGRQGRRAHPGSGAGEGGHRTGNRQRRGRGSRRCRWECLRRGSRCAQADAIRKEVTSSRVPCWGERPAGLNITRLRRRRACCLNRRQGAADLSRLVWRTCAARSLSGNCQRSVAVCGLVTLRPEFCRSYVHH